MAAWKACRHFFHEIFTKHILNTQYYACNHTPTVPMPTQFFHFKPSMTTTAETTKDKQQQWENRHSDRRGGYTWRKTRGTV